MWHRGRGFEGSGAVGDRERGREDRQALVLAVGEHEHRPEVQPGQGVSLGVALGFDQAQCAFRRFPCRDGLVGDPLLAGERDQPGRHVPVVAQLLPQPNGVGGRRDCLLRAVHVVQRPRVGVEQRGALGGG